jgi:TonB family protein
MNVRRPDDSLGANRSLGAEIKLALTALTLLLCLTAAPLQLAAQTSIKSGGRKVLTEVTPEYPSYLKSIHIEGQVRLDVIVLASGSVSKVEIRGGNPILAENAAKAVMKWKYVPAEKETVEEVRFSFTSH